MAGGNPDTEAELVRLVRKKDASAMRRLYDAFAGYLFSVCARYVGDADTAKDILQEALIKIFSSIGRFEWRGEGSLKAWMKRIAVNEALMHLRGRNRSSEMFPDIDVPDVPEDEEPDVDSVPMDKILQMIKDLPDGYRTVFNLYVFEQKSHREIAALLGISENTSYSQYSRAKALLAKQIRQYERERQN